jgi:hypothetical protein
MKSYLKSNNNHTYHGLNLKDVSKMGSVSSSLSKLTAVCYLAIPQFQGILEKQHLCHDPIVIKQLFLFLVFIKTAEN